MKNYIADGNTYPHTCLAVATAGAVILLADTISVAKTNGAIGELIAVQTAGVVRLPKLAGSDIAQGKKVYWDATNGQINLTSSGNTLAGRAFEAAGAGTTFVNVDLNA